MTNTSNHYEEFRKRMKKYVDTQSDAKALNEGSPEEKASARVNAISRIEEMLGPEGRIGAEHTDAAQLAVNLGAFTPLDRDLARNYFEKNTDKIIEEIPDEQLAGAYYNVAPRKVGNKRHDAVAETHTRALQLEGILKDFAEGKITPFDKEALRGEVLSGALRQRLNELKSQTGDEEILTGILAAAKDTLQRAYAHSDTLLMNAGTQLYKATKEEFERKFHNYSKAKYARANLYEGVGNLLDNQRVDEAMDAVHSVRNSYKRYMVAKHLKELREGPRSQIEYHAQELGKFLNKDEVKRIKESRLNELDRAEDKK